MFLFVLVLISWFECNRKHIFFVSIHMYFHFLYLFQAVCMPPKAIYIESSQTACMIVVCHSVVFNSLWPRFLHPWDSPGKSTGMGCYFLLQGIFLTQWSNPCLLYLLHCRQIPWLSYEGSPNKEINVITFLFVSFLNNLTILRTICYIYFYSVFKNSCISLACWS